MDELIGRLAAKAGVNDAVNEKNIGIIPGFLRSEGFSHNVRVLIDRIPGADAAISASAGGNRPTALMGSRLMAAGHDETGTDGITEIAPTPGLSQLA
jgi:hypothetical protein